MLYGPTREKTAIPLFYELCSWLNPGIVAILALSEFCGFVCFNDLTHSRKGSIEAALWILKIWNNWKSLLPNVK